MSNTKDKTSFVTPKVSDASSSIVGRKLSTTKPSTSKKELDRAIKASLSCSAHTETTTPSESEEDEKTKPVTKGPPPDRNFQPPPRLIPDSQRGLKIEEFIQLDDIHTHGGPYNPTVHGPHRLEQILVSHRRSIPDMEGYRDCAYAGVAKGGKSSATANIHRAPKRILSHVSQNLSDLTADYGSRGLVGYLRGIWWEVYLGPNATDEDAENVDTNMSNTKDKTSFVTPKVSDASSSIVGRKLSTTKPSTSKKELDRAIKASLSCSAHTETTTPSESEEDEKTKPVTKGPPPDRNFQPPLVRSSAFSGTCGYFKSFFPSPVSKRWIPNSLSLSISGADASQNSTKIKDHQIM